MLYFLWVTKLKSQPGTFFEMLWQKLETVDSLDNKPKLEILNSRKPEHRKGLVEKPQSSDIYIDDREPNQPSWNTGRQKTFFCK